MSWIKKLFKVGGGAVVSGFKSGAAKGIIGYGNKNKGATQEEILADIQNQYMTNNSSPISFANTITKESKALKNNFINHSVLYRSKLPLKSEKYPVVDDDSWSDKLFFKTPDWDYGDWINERGMWQRQITSISGEPGWFYFKIFFDFDTQQGLFGGILNNDNIMNSTNSAGKFLKMSENLSDILYSKLNLEGRLTALYKFTSILSYISTNAPWFFKAVKGLQKANDLFYKEFTKEKFIEIACNPDAIDMRLNTMMDLYKYATYDNINFKEIIPENLRKFDMTVLIFNTPIKKFHTAMRSRSNKEFGYKNMINANSEYTNFMTYKMFTFKNCEFSRETLSSALSSDISNETAVKLEGGSIKINYDRVYTHTANEFFGLVFGVDGIYYNEYSNKYSKSSDVKINALKSGYIQKQRYKVLQNALSNHMYNPKDEKNYKELIDASEELSNVLIHTKLDTANDLGKNFLLSALKTSYSSQSIFGNLYGDVAPGSQYFKDKIKRLKNSSAHISMESEFLKSQQDYDNFNFKEKARNTIRNIKYS